MKEYYDALRFPDQDIMNLVFYGKVKYISRLFNVVKPTFDDLYFWNKKRIVIMHYAGRFKPWDTKAGTNTKYFWEYAKYSPYYKELSDDFWHTFNLNNQDLTENENSPSN